MAEMSKDSGIENDFEQKHKQQRKDLQAKIMKLKHSVPKGDKKKKQEMMELVAKLEAELDEKQAHELANSSKMPSVTMTHLVDAIGKKMENLNASTDGQNQKGARISKAQKRRDKKAEKERQREQSIAKQEQDNLLGARHIEAEKLKSALKERGLKIFEIPSNGDCLYAAAIHQLFLQNVSLSAENLRKQTAHFMREHMEDFFPFLGDQEDGQPFTQEKYATYCNDIESTSAWGGQLELRAISHILKQPIEIVQADAPTITIGEEYKGVPLVLTYHRHAYGLGEHYNSVHLAAEDSSEDGFN